MIKNTPKLRFNEYSDNWIECPLSDLANLARGKFSVRPRNDPRYFGGNIPFIQTSDIVKSSIYVEQYSQTLNELGLKVSKVFPVGTIMITIAANIGDVAILKYPMACPDSLVGIEAKEFVANNIWLMYSLLLKKDELESLATQNAQKNINLQILNSLNIFIPAYQEQTKIANFLSSVDKKITLTYRKIELLQQYKKGMIQKLFSQKIRFKDDNGCLFSKWEQTTLSCVASITMGTSPGSSYYNTNQNGLPLIQGNADIKNKYSKPRVYTSQITKECHYNDILLSVRAPVGEVARSKHHACIGRGIAALKANGRNDQEFLYQLLLSIENKWDRISQGSTFESINTNDIKTLPIEVPSLSEQKKIADFLSSIDDKITIENNKLDKLKQWKQGLLQQMFV
ncbi:restriction endonuclease subunit S [Proteus mirabilis]|nr:restriction endonuclease subunit S [Proteus mirabilis]